jgi:hypothetical protein
MKAHAAVVVFTAALLAGSAAVLSQDERKVYGAGTTPCARWTEWRTGNSSEWFVPGQWMLGFVSAVNQYSKAIPAQVDARSMAAQVDAYCRTYPEDDVSDATRALVEVLLSDPQP